MSDRPTPIVDSCEFTVPFAGKVIVSKTARRLERERDDYKEAFEIASRSADDQMFQKRDAERERDEAREKAERYRLEANALMLQRDEAREALIEARKHREQLNSLLQSYEACWDEIKTTLGEPEEGDQTCDLDRVLKAIRERNEAREALMKIEEIFIDGGDTYLDFVRVGNIARAALEK